ncbi:hypothetical protein DRE_03746 [Drechslerella stenobrocha 248]|uniref:RING-type domain-containing protein n=1 Tax=Drechslerella stenobrocha 248 TaxID=1043628 RepID=W7HU63_9PEZI|nr:hypothetical protein DRE_03746 [Drechslerella stenobrocha 248]
MASSLAIPLEEIPVRLRCSMCNNLAQDAYRLPCCEQSICGSCQSSLPTVCKICDHTPLKAEDCKIHSSLRTTVTIFLRTAEKKHGSLSKAKKDTTPAQPPADKPSDPSDSKPQLEAPREASPPAQSDANIPQVETTDGKADDKMEEQKESGAANDEPNGPEEAPPTQATQGGNDMNNQNQGGPLWNNQQGTNQYPDQSQYQGYNNVGWSNGYDQSSGYGMPQAGWGNGMQNMMDQSGNMNSFNGMQSFPDGYGGMGNMGMVYSGYGQGGSYGNSGAGMQGQGDWGNGWNMRNGMDGANFNSSGMNAGFYPGAGGYNHQSYGNHQTQQSHMMPHQQFQNRGFNHNQYRNYPNQNMRGNFGQQQQFGGPPRGGNTVNNHNRSHDSQMQPAPSGNDNSSIQGVNGNDGGQDQGAATGEQANPSFNPRARGESSEKVLVDEVSTDEKDPISSMTSETNGATHAISSIDIKDDSTAVEQNPDAAGSDLGRKSEPTNTSGGMVNGNQHQAQASHNQPARVEQQQQQATVPGVLGAPTGPRAMRERGERGRGRGRGFFGGMGRGGYHQTQISGSDEIGGNQARTGSIASSSKGGAPAAAPNSSDYDDTSRRQSRAEDAQHSPVESRKDSHDWERRRSRSRSRSRSRTRKHRHHRSRSRKRSSSPRHSRGDSRDRSRSRSRDRKRYRDGDREKNKDRDREKSKREKDASRSHRSSHKSSSHKHRRDRSRSRSRDRRDAKDKDEVNDVEAKDMDRSLDAEPKARHREKDGEDRQREKEKDSSSRDDRKRDSDKKSRKRSRSRYRSHGHHKRSRGADEDSRDRHGNDSERKPKSSRSSRRHSTRYEDEESATERERRVEQEREEERWSKR